MIFLKRPAVSVLVVAVALASCGAPRRADDGDDGASDAGVSDGGGNADAGTGGDAGSDAGTGGDAGTVTQGNGYTLTVRGARELGYSLSDPASARRLVIIDVSLSNQTRDASLPVAELYFTVRTEAGLDIMANGWMGANGCPSNTRVAKGGRFDCTLAAEMGWTQRAKELRYSPSDTDAGVVVALHVSACTECGDNCVDVNTNPEHCGQCDNEANTLNGQTCRNGALACEEPGYSACNDYCVDLKTGIERDHQFAADCGVCGQSTPDGGLCNNGVPACPNASPTLCTSGGSTRCSALDGRQGDDCGRCGHVCGTGFACKSRVAAVGSEPFACVTSVRKNAYLAGLSCDGVCQQKGYECLDLGTALVRYYTGTAVCGVVEGVPSCTEPLPQSLVIQDIPECTGLTGTFLDVTCACSD